jgi:hypothetical protein
MVAAEQVAGRPPQRSEPINRPRAINLTITAVAALEW